MKHSKRNTKRTTKQIEQNKILLDACKTGDLNGVNKAIQNGAHENVGQCLIRVCIGTGSLFVMKRLMQCHHSEVRDEHFFHACKRGHLDIIRYLFSIWGQLQLNASFEGACFGGQIDVVQFLVEEAKKYPLYRFQWSENIKFACKGKQIRMIQFLIQSKLFRLTARHLLMLCAFCCVDLDTVQMFIDTMQKQDHPRFLWDDVFGMLNVNFDDDIQVSHQRKVDISFLFLRNHAPYIGLKNDQIPEWLNQGIETHVIQSHRFLKQYPDHVIDNFFERRKRIQKYVYVSVTFIQHVNVHPFFQTFVLPCISFCISPHISYHVI